MRVSVFVHPKSRYPRVEKRGDTLHIYVSSPAIHGEATEAARRMLAQWYHVSKTSVALVKGIRSKNKIFSIE